MNGLGKGLAEVSPSFRLYGSALWVAWITIIYSGDCIVVPLESAYATTSTTFMFSTMAIGVLLIAAACAASTFDRLMRNPAVLIASGIGAGLCTVGIAYEGAIPLPLFYLCASLSGAFTGMLALKCACIFAEIDTKRSIAASSASLMIGILIYSLATMCAMYFSPEVVLAITAPLPLMGILMTLVPSDESHPAEDDASRRVPAAFWRIAAFCGILVFAMSSVRGYYPQLMDSDGFATSRGVVALGLILVALAVAGIDATRPRNGSFAGFFYWMLLLPVVAIAPIALLGVGSSAAGALGGVANGVVCMAAWCLLTGISHHSGMSAVRVFGFGFGTVVIAMTLGFAAGTFFGAIIDQQYATAAGIIYLVASLGIAVLLLRRDDIESFASPTPELVTAALGGEGSETTEIDSAQNMRTAEAGATFASPTSVDAGETDDARPGKFRQKCLAIAEEHGLSARETEVFLLLAKRLEAKAIAEELYVSFNTARTHITKIYSKLGVHSRRELFDLIDDYRI